MGIVAGNRVVISFSPQNRFAREMTFEEKNRRFIEHELERFFGKKLVLEAGDETGAAAEPAAPDSAPAPKRASMDSRLEAIADGAPAVKKLIEEYDGELFAERGDGQEASGE